MFGTIIFAESSFADLEVTTNIRWTDKGKDSALWVEQPKIVNP